MTDLADAALVAAVFLLAGTVKGVAGFGFPTIVLGLLALTRPLPQAMALMLVPSLATNLWQAFAGGALRTVLHRLWSFLLASALGTLATAGLLARADGATLSGGLGVLLVLSAALALLGPEWPEPGAARERWLSPLVGALSGAVNGLTGSYLMPAGPYLAALRLPREVFVQGFGLGVVVATLALAAGLLGNGLLPSNLGLTSVVGLAPAFLGLALGQRLRRLLPEAAFRKVVQAGLGLLGAALAARAFL